jgi:hypothetical protein
MTTPAHKTGRTDRDILTNVVAKFDELPLGRNISDPDVKYWLIYVLAPAINEARAALSASRSTGDQS